MYGFLITKNCNINGRAVLDAPKILNAGSISFFYAPLPRFEKDKLFYEDETKLVLLDGVILNKAELLADYGTEDWRGVFDTLFAEDKETFPRRLRGSFCGAVFEKATERLYLFTNQSGEKTVYYTCREGFFLSGSHNNILTAALREQGITPEPDIQAHRELLSTGSILHGKTPFAGINRLMAGKCMVLENGVGAKEQRYHMFHNVPEHELTLEQCVEEYDKRFRKAIDRIYAKSREYGYQAESDLSGGLDSRMATWVAHELGYRNILNVCYCQSGKIDHKTSRKIAHDLGNSYFFLPMDGGVYLMDVDEAVDKTGGQINFDVSTGASRAVKEIKKSHTIGLFTTGLLGEIVNAYWVEGECHTPSGYTKNRYSSVVPFHVPDEYSKEYENFEQMNLYEHSVPLYMSSGIIRQQDGEVFSPYVDVDVLEFGYRIPLKWRRNYYFDQTWIITKYPEAAKYVWQTKRKPVDKAYYNKPYLPKIWGDAGRFAVRCINKAGRTFRLRLRLPVNSDMNPQEVWYQNNRKLRDFFDKYYSENIDKVSDASLKADIEATFNNGRAIDKICAINLLAVYKRYF